MQFYDAFNSKWSFEDGGAVPAEAETCRTIYVRVLNRLLEQAGADVRVIAYDRPGCHNPLLICRCALADYLTRNAATIATGTSEPPDPALTWTDSGKLEKAEDEAMEMCLDEFVEVSVTVDSAFEAFLDNIGKDDNQER